MGGPFPGIILDSYEAHPVALGEEILLLCDRRSAKALIGEVREIAT